MKERVKEMNEILKNETPEKVLHFMTDEFPGKVVFSTSFSAEDQVLTEMISRLQIPVSIFTLDTGRMFQETYDLFQVTKARYKSDIAVYFPDRNRVESMVKRYGINLFYDSPENRKMCCEVRKVEPLTRALKGMKIWIDGRRRSQSATRSDLSLCEWDEGYGMIRVQPLYNWTEERLWSHIRDLKIPYNPLHDKGFPSIGCLPCTRAIHPGEDIRAGRWWWENSRNKECGIFKRSEIPKDPGGIN